MTTHAILRGSFSKLDEGRRLAFGWASVVSKAGSDEPLVDLQDDVLDLPSLEASVYDYVRTSRDADEMHERTGVGTLVESVMFTPDKIEKMGLPPESVPVGWWTGFYIADDDVWAKVRDGTYRAFSISGTGTREALSG